MVSDKHANFILNAGTATAADIEALIAEVRAAVERTSGVQLELEVRVIGEPRAAKGEPLMFGRKANRRRVESRLARVKLPTIGAAWRAALRAVLALPLVAVALYGAFKGVAARCSISPSRKLVVEGTFQRVTPIQVEAAVADGLDAGFLTVDLERCASACSSSTGSIEPTSAGVGPTR